MALIYNNCVTQYFKLLLQIPKVRETITYFIKRVAQLNLDKFTSPTTEHELQPWLIYSAELEFRLQTSGSLWTVFKRANYLVESRSNENCLQWRLWIIQSNTDTESVTEPEISEVDVSKPLHKKPKLLACLDTTRAKWAHGLVFLSFECSDHFWNHLLPCFFNRMLILTLTIQHKPNILTMVVIALLSLHLFGK